MTTFYKIQFFAVPNRMLALFFGAVLLNIAVMAPALSQARYYSTFNNTVAASHVAVHADQVTVPVVNLTVALGSFATPENVANTDTTDFCHYASTASVVSNIGLLGALLPGLSIYAQGDLYLGSDIISGKSLPVGSVAGFVLDNQPGVVNVSLGTLVTLSTYLDGVLQETSTALQSTPVPRISATAQDIHFTATRPFNQVRAALNGSLLSLDINLDPAKGINFYFAYGSSTGTILPVGITAFTAAPQAGAAKLEWSTSGETNNAGFAVERSADGIGFGQIGFVPSKAVGGNSSSVLGYTATDASPLGGVNYYRLRQDDLDGHAAYSATRSVSFSGTAALKIFPNPATGLINIQVPSEGGYVVELFGTDGKRFQVSRLEANSGILSLVVNKGNVPTGMYSLRATKVGSKDAFTYGTVLIK